MSVRLLAAKIVVAGIAAAAGVTAGVQGGHTTASLDAASATQYRTYIVQPGDSLSGIAARFCGSASDYPELARASGIGNAALIYPGQKVVLACGGGGSTDTGLPYVNGSSVAANGQANIPGTIPSQYSYYGLEMLWESVGGASWAASTAACIAEHESGGNTYALSPTNDYGLWQIHNGGDAMYAPVANAQMAVSMSRDGTNWSPWTTAPDCGV